MWVKIANQYAARADDLEHIYYQQMYDIKYDPGTYHLGLNLISVLFITLVSETCSNLNSGKDIRTHINSFLSIASKLREMGNSLPVNLLVNKIICSLPESYKEFRARWRDVPVAEVDRRRKNHCLLPNTAQ